MLLSGYDLDKAAQVVAFFALKQGRSINVLKVSKLVYLAERECMDRYDEPLFFDHLVSMPDGPVTSVTLNFMNGNISDPRWSKFVGPRVGFDIPLARRDIALSDFDHLSPADIEILESLWAKFGHMDQFQIRNWTHNPENVPEWRDPNGSSMTITHMDVFRRLGKSDPASLNDDINQVRKLYKTLNIA